jgi:hypothetical protein
MAAGCERCLDTVIPELLMAGTVEEDIRRAVEIGQRVKKAAVEYMEEVADLLVGTRLAQEASKVEGDNDKAGGSSGCCG